MQIPFHSTTRNTCACKEVVSHGRDLKKEIKKREEVAAGSLIRHGLLGYLMITGLIWREIWDK